MKRCNKNTRAAKFGTLIECPNCGHRNTVYHFSWSEHTCRACDRDIKKACWVFVKHNETKVEPQVRRGWHDQQMRQAVALIPATTELPWPLQHYR